MYDTARGALKALTDDELRERVAVKVLRTRYPGLRITGPSSDLNRDAFSRPLFGLVRGWAAGNTADRARAAVAVRHRWKDPIWQELVPGLLDRGLSEAAQGLNSYLSLPRGRKT